MSAGSLIVSTVGVIGAAALILGTGGVGVFAVAAAAMVVSNLMTFVSAYATERAYEAKEIDCATYQMTQGWNMVSLEFGIITGPATLKSSPSTALTLSSLGSMIGAIGVIASLSGGVQLNEQGRRRQEMEALL
jgi:hypothetical protein